MLWPRRPQVRARALAKPLARALCREHWTVHDSQCQNK